MELTNETGKGWITGDGDIAQAIQALDPDANPFTVLSRGDENYIQTAFENGGLVVEKREGSVDRHFRAWRMNGGGSFSKAEVEQLFLAYAGMGQQPMTIEWRPMDMTLRGNSRALYWSLWALPWIGGVYLLYRFVLSSYDVWKLFR